MEPSPSSSSKVLIPRAVSLLEDPSEDAEATAPPASTSRKLEVTVAVIALVATGILFFLASNISVRAELPGMTPRSWPKLLAGLGFGLSLILLLTSLLAKPQDRGDLDAATGSGWGRLLMTIAATVAFMVLWPLLGFVFVAPVFISAVTAIAGGRNLISLLAYPLITTGTIYALFHLLLRVPL